MVARRQFRNDTTVFSMNVNLTVQTIRQQAIVAIINSNPGVIAGSFNTQYYQWLGP
jgi:hypothetical protein